MNNNYWLGIVLLLCFFSCKRCVVEDCKGYETITLNLVNYAKSESDSVLIKKYKLNSNYTLIVDSLYAKDAYYYGDTMSVGFIDRQANSIEDLKNEYDLEIINLFDNRVVRISEIDREIKTQEICSGGLFGGKTTSQVCNNKLLGYNYSVNAGSILSDGNLIYVLK